MWFSLAKNRGGSFLSRMIIVLVLLPHLQLSPTRRLCAGTGGEDSSTPSQVFTVARSFENTYRWNSSLHQGFWTLNSDLNSVTLRASELRFYIFQTFSGPFVWAEKQSVGLSRVRTVVLRSQYWVAWWANRAQRGLERTSPLFESVRRSQFTACRPKTPLCP